MDLDNEVECDIGLYDGLFTRDDTNSSLLLNNQLNCYYQNVRGLRTKLTSLSLSVTSSDYDILFFTETWLTEDISNLELGMNDFDIYRKDRNASTSSASRGGGVLIAVKRTLSSRLLLTACDDIEAVFVLLHIGTKHIILSNVTFWRKIYIR